MGMGARLIGQQHDAAGPLVSVNRVKRCLFKRREEIQNRKHSVSCVRRELDHTIAIVLLTVAIETKRAVARYYIHVVAGIKDRRSPALPDPAQASVWSRDELGRQVQ